MYESLYSIACVCIVHAVKSTSLTAEEVQRGLINRITGDSDVHLGYGSPSLLHPVFELFGKMELKWDQGPSAVLVVYTSNKLCKAQLAHSLAQTQM